MKNATTKLLRPTVLFLTLIFIGVMATGCLTSAKRLTSLKLDMPKSEVRQVMGEPTSARGSMRNKFGQVIEIWEYVLDRGGQPDATYWLYFYDDKLVQWGEAGDWRKEADRIYEYRFGPAGTHITQ
jgi:hypothetical protein